MKVLPLQERDAINYFTDKGFYRSKQDFRTIPNKFDPKESFLIKIHDQANRDRFLKSLKESN